MTKKIIGALALFSAMLLLFAGCSKNKDTLMDDGKTTTAQNTTVRVTDRETTTLMRDDAGEPESTSLKSALGDAAGDAAEGAGEIIGDMGDAAERAGDKINDALR